MTASVDPLTEASGEGQAGAEERWQIEVFYDGDCPLCKREIAMLRRRDQRHLIRFTDIADFRFDPQELGLQHSELMAEIHGRLPDGTVIQGVEVFRRLYEAIGFKRLVKLSRLPVVATALGMTYKCFAKIRLKLPGRSCGQQCSR